MEDRHFLDVYGDWDPLTPAQLAAMMEGFDPPWWIVGGYAMEAFTGVTREHEDLDVVVFSHDLDALRAQLGHRFHLWSNDGGTFRVIDDEQPEPLHPLSQVWLREDARSPWRVDCILNASREGRWVSRHDERLEADLDDVTWVAGDGVRYLAPEVVLLFKAKHHRPKDDADLAHAWPLLDDVQRSFLRDGVERGYGVEHPWWERLTRDG